MSDSQPRRKAIFVNRYYFPDESATSQILTGIARGLADPTAIANHIDVHVVTSRQLYEVPNAALAAREKVDGVCVHRVWSSQFGRAMLAGRAVDYASFYLTAAMRLFWLLRRGDIVIAKTDPPMLSILCALIARMRGAKLVNWLQDIFPEVATQLNANPLPGALNRVLLRLRDRSLQMAYCNVVLGERMREHLLARNITEQKICIVENWADIDVAPKDAVATQLRKLHGLHDKFVVAYSGNLGRAHEYETLLQAAKLLHQDPSIVFLMIGGGANMRLLHNAVERNELHNFLFLSYQPRELLMDSLTAADVHLISLLPALEGLIVPSKFYGILAAGRPAIFIGDADGELARKIRRADCGAVVSIGQGNELAEEILRLQREPDRAREQGVRARALYDSEHTLGKAVDKWQQLLDSA